VSPPKNRNPSTLNPNSSKTLVAMKTLIPLTAFAALIASGISPAQTPAYSKPSGYVTETFKAGQFNLFGLTLNNSPIVSGTLTSLTSTTASDSTKDFGSLLSGGKTYILEIVQEDSPAFGSIAEVTAWSGGAITTTPTDLTLIGAASGNKYTIRLAPTISDVFGASNSAGLLAGNTSTADILWISDGGGNLSRYYYATASFPITAGWRRIGGGNADSAAIPIIYADGMILQRRGGTDLELVLTGAVKTTPVVYPLTGGAFNYLGAVFPVGSTLDSSGLQAQVTPGNPNTADIVWVPNGTGGYNRYYYATASFPITVGWRSIGGGNADRKDDPLTSGVIVQRRGATANVKISPPASYSNL
jgi:hypothetical protein